MPIASLQPCEWPGCAALVARGLCARHTAAPPARPAKRPGRLWYLVARWKHPHYGLRARVLREQPVCQWPAGCRRAAKEVDHVVPHKGNPNLFWSRANLQALCTYHHRLKTVREQHGDDVSPGGSGSV